VEVKFDDGATEQYEDTHFASGGQGKLYRSLDGTHTVKLYKPDSKKEKMRFARIRTLIDDFNPAKDDAYWANYFAWPQKLVVAPHAGFRMSYISMKTLDKHLPFYYSDIYGDLKSEERGWFIGRIATAIKLACAANRLASLGLCYSDFSEKNIMVDPFEGKMTLIDCDSLFVPDRLPPEIVGTGNYRAPELYSGLVKNPSLETDRHAFAVVLYLWLVGYHPLEGDKVYSTEIFDDGEEDQQDKLRYGSEALYIEHPKDASNRLSGQKVTAHTLGDELEKLFQRAFVKGLHNPKERPRPFEWQRVLINTYDRIIPCPSLYCDWRMFVVPTNMRRLTCPYCLQPVKYPRTLPIVSLLQHSGKHDLEEYDGKPFHYVLGWPDRQLHEWHVKSHHSPIPNKSMPNPDMTPMAYFEYDGDKRRWYLHNSHLSDMHFRFVGEPSDVWRPWPQYTSIALETGMLIQFGDAPIYTRARIKLEEID